VYAIVRCGGRQEKVALDDVVTVDKLPGEAGSSVTLEALLVVDGERVISDPGEVGRYQVTADIVGDAAGPKINMIQYRNKTGYRRRLGHRQRYTQIRITGIGTEAKPQAKKQAKAHAEPQAEAHPEPQAEAQPKPQAKAHAEPQAEAHPEPQAEAHPEPQAEAHPEPQAEAHPEPQAETQPKRTPRAEAKAEEN
jgi:large subunit ribosomal protein L21